MHLYRQNLTILEKKQIDLEENTPDCWALALKVDIIIMNFGCWQTSS